MVEMLPAKTRCSTLAIGYNLCLGFIGGTTPLVATYLVDRTANDFSPVYYLMAASSLSFLTIKGLREGAQKPLL
jgi:MHS family proline/betaine transporter-like MFS transporter